MMRLKSPGIVLLAYNALDAGVCIEQSTLDSYGEHRSFLEATLCVLSRR